MKEYGIVVSGDAETKGIGCMTDDALEGLSTTRWSRSGCSRPTLDFTQAYTTEFVCKGVGMDLEEVS